jgi:predicted dithiol-disulfide oxidoreductase (DUF899 family)
MSQYKRSGWREKLAKKRKAKFSRDYVVYEIPQDEVVRSERVEREYKATAVKRDWTGTPL